MIERRGQSPFNDANLLAALACYPVDDGRYSRADGLALDEYLDFYGLNFADTQCAMGIVGVAGERIAVQTFQPSIGHVGRWALVCHGYYDHAGLYGHLIQRLLDRGVGVLIFDHLGHGLSTGQPATIDSFQSYVDVLECVHHLAQDIIGCQPSHWIGQSMGGAVLMEYEHQQQLAPLGEFVLLAPLVRPYGWPLLQWYFAVIKRWMSVRPRDMRTNMHAEFNEFLTRDPFQAKILPVAWVQAMVDWFTRFETYPASKVRARIVQGFADKTVSYRHDLPVLNRRYQRASILTIPEARHHLVNEIEPVQQHLWAWLDRECEW